MRNSVLIGCLTLFCLLTSVFANAQVTTATLSGTIQSKDGKPLAGATVKIEFREAGITKIIITQNNGSFQVPNLRVGGPYKVTVSFVGYTEKSEENIFLELGQNRAVDIQLEVSSGNLSGITVRGSRKFSTTSVQVLLPISVHAS